jgi:hypothetical protein
MSNHKRYVAIKPLWYLKNESALEARGEVDGL